MMCEQDRGPLEDHASAFRILQLSYSNTATMPVRLVEYNSYKTMTNVSSSSPPPPPRLWADLKEHHLCFATVRRVQETVTEESKTTVTTHVPLFWNAKMDMLQSNSYQGLLWTLIRQPAAERVTFAHTDVPTETILCYRTLLQVHCPFMEMLLRHQPENNACISISEICSFEVLYAVLSLIYLKESGVELSARQYDLKVTHFAESDPEFGMDLLIALHTFECSVLFYQCHDVLLHMLTLGRVPMQNAQYMLWRLSHWCHEAALPELMGRLWTVVLGDFSVTSDEFAILTQDLLDVNDGVNLYHLSLEMLTQLIRVWTPNDNSTRLRSTGSQRYGSNLLRLILQWHCVLEHAIDTGMLTAKPQPTDSQQTEGADESTVRDAVVQLRHRQQQYCVNICVELLQKVPENMRVHVIHTTMNTVAKLMPERQQLLYAFGYLILTSDKQ